MCLDCSRGVRQIRPRLRRPSLRRRRLHRTANGRLLRGACAGRSPLGDCRPPPSHARSRARGRWRASRERDLVVAPSQDQAAVDAIVSRSRIVLSTAGPFALYGTPIVDACVRFGTHYVDITGETPWMREIAGRYHAPAASGGTRMIPCCGFDSVPSDLGAMLMARHIRDTLQRPVRRSSRLLPVQRRSQRRHGRVAPEHAERRRRDWRRRARRREPARRTNPDGQGPAIRRRARHLDRTVRHGAHQLAGGAPQPHAVRGMAGAVRPERRVSGSHALRPAVRALPRALLPRPASDSSSRR